MSKSQQANRSGDYRKISFTNKCGVDSEGINGGTWSEEEHGWRGGGCARFDPDWVTEYGCTAGDCPYNFNDFRNGIGYDFGYPKASWSTFSEVYFKCTAAPSTVEPTTTLVTTTETTTTAGTLPTEPVTMIIDPEPVDPTTTRPRSTTTPEMTMPDVTEPEATRPPAPIGEPGRWQKCEELDGVRGGTIECAIDICTLTCNDGSDPLGPPRTRCLKNDDGSFTWNKDLGSCAAINEPEPTRPVTTPEATRPDSTTPEPTRPDSTRPVPTTPEMTRPDSTRPDITEPEATRPPAPVGDAGRWQKCEELDGVRGGTIRCAADVCALICDDGSDPIGAPRAKCLKNDDGTFTWNKELGSCAAIAEPEPTRPDVTTPEPTRPDVTEPEATRPEGPAPVGEDGKWQKCDELEGVRGGKIRCAVDVCALTCDDGSEVVGNAKTKCLRNDDRTFSWNKKLGTCPVSDDEVTRPDLTTPEPTRPDVTEPVGEVGPAPVGEDGRWQKCDELEGVRGGNIRCAVDVCALTCDKGFVLEGNAKTKCLRNDDRTFSWNKRLGTCIASDDGTDVDPVTEAPVDEVGPAPVGEDGKWQKCDELEGVRGGKIRCAVDVCALTCDDGSEVVGNAKTKCLKNADKTFSWNKRLGTCAVSGDDSGTDEPDVVEPEPVDPNPGCKDPSTMITDKNLSPICKLNAQGKYQCKLQCADGLFFNGKKGKTNIKLYCKCRDTVCKWQNENKKVINKATMSKYTCE